MRQDNAFERAIVGGLVLIAAAVEGVAEANGVRCNLGLTTQDVGASCRNVAPFLGETPLDPAEQRIRELDGRS